MRKKQFEDSAITIILFSEEDVCTASGESIFDDEVDDFGDRP